MNYCLSCDCVSGNFHSAKECSCKSVNTQLARNNKKNTEKMDIKIPFQ